MREDWCVVKEKKEEDAKRATTTRKFVCLVSRQHPPCNPSHENADEATYVRNMISTTNEDDDESF